MPKKHSHWMDVLDQYEAHIKRLELEVATLLIKLGATRAEAEAAIERLRTV